MLDLDITLGALKQLQGFAQNHLPLDRWPNRWPNPALWSGAAVLLGVVLAFWGARLLRPLYVLAFMVIGGAIGVRLAGVRQIDHLIGLTLGAGLGALVAFIFFRGWVGLSTGALAVFLLVTAGSPRLVGELNNYTNNVRLGVGTGSYAQVLHQKQLRLVSWEQTSQFTLEFWQYLRDQHGSDLIKSAVLIGAVWLVGTLLGLLLPGLVMIGLTCVGGVALLAIGASVLLSTHWPQAWSGISANRGWFLAGLGVLLLAAISYQAHHRRAPIPVTTPLPAAA